MAGTTIRPAAAEDAEAVERLRIAGWQTAYRGIIPDAYLDSLPVDVSRRRKHLESLPEGFRNDVAIADGCIIAWISAGPCRDPDRPGPRHGEIFACYVHPDWWRMGIGHLLMEHSLQALAEDGRDDVTLWVLEANDRARRFYAAFKFVPDGTRKLLDFGEPVPELRYRRPPPARPPSQSAL
jgi:ribosomal protein S18 acetylase RimI-like enzyme